MFNRKNKIYKLNKNILEKMEKHHQIAEKILDSITPDMQNLLENAYKVHAIIHPNSQRIGRIQEIVKLSENRDLIKIVEKIDKTPLKYLPSIGTALDITNKLYSIISLNHDGIFKKSNQIQEIIPSEVVETEKMLEELAKILLDDFSKISYDDVGKKSLEVSEERDESIDNDKLLAFEVFIEEIKKMEGSKEFRDTCDEYTELKINSDDEEKIKVTKKKLLSIIVFVVTLSPYSQYLDKILMLYNTYDSLSNVVSKEKNQ